MPLLSQSSNLSAIFVPLAIVLVLTGFLLAVLSFVRRKLHVEQGASRDFSLGDLRALHQKGELSDEEFERAKARLVMSVQSDLAKKALPQDAASRLQTEIKSEIDPDVPP